MELSEFITETLLDIKKGIHEANVKIAEMNGKVLGMDATIQYEIEATHNREKNKGIHFDVAVVVSNESGTKGGGKITIPVLNIGGGAEGSTAIKEERVSRISFEVSAFSSVG